MKTMKKTKKYEKLSMKVVKLQVQNQLLTGSSENRTTVQDYTKHDYVEE